MMVYLFACVCVGKNVDLCEAKSFASLIVYILFWWNTRLNIFFFYPNVVPRTYAILLLFRICCVDYTSFRRTMAFECWQIDVKDGYFAVIVGDGRICISRFSNFVSRVT